MWTWKISNGKKPTLTTWEPMKIKQGKAIPLQAWTGPEGSRRLRLPDFKTISTWRWQGCQPYALATFTPPRNIPGTHFCQRLSQPQGHGAARRIMSKKNSIDTIGNQTRDLPACSAVPQPTAPPRAPANENTDFKLHNIMMWTHFQLHIPSVWASLLTYTALMWQINWQI